MIKGILSYRPVIAIFFLIAGAIIALFTLGPSFDKFSFLYDDFTISSCIEGFGINESEYTQNPEDARTVHRVCYDKLHAQGLLNEYQIRRVNFQNQHIAENIIMWMVVILTLSGVVLAGYQIIGSGRIYENGASLPHENASELSIEKGKIYLKSTVTGLFILVFSFAFFYTYIIYVYTITEIGDDTPPPLSSTGVLLPSGGAGNTSPAPSPEGQ